jgi:hypothetical protein
MRIRSGLAIGLLPLFAVALHAAELKPATKEAWDKYIRMANARMEARAHGKEKFLWADEVADRSERLREGEILVSPVGETGAHSVPHGLIHDWMGAVFIPNVSVSDVLMVVRDYDHYKEFYKPTVADSKLLNRADTKQDFMMLWQQKVAFVTAALETQYESRYFQLDQTRWYNIASTTRVQQIEDYGLPSAHKLPPDQGSGYIWRLCSLARYEERDGGVYVEVETIGLSRDIPFAFRWIVNPIVDRLPRSTILTTLQETRDAVHPTIQASARENRENRGH